MNTEKQIEGHISSLSEPKRSEIQKLHQLIMQMHPECRLWFDTGIDSSGKTVTNPTIGYGFQELKYADGKTKEFFQIGVAATKTGISVYILGIKDKKYLNEAYGKEIGKAKVTGYCISFKTLKDINADVLLAAIQFGLENRNED